MDSHEEKFIYLNAGGEANRAVSLRDFLYWKGPYSPWEMLRRGGRIVITTRHSDFFPRQFAYLLSAWLLSRGNAAVATAECEHPVDIRMLLKAAARAVCDLLLAPLSYWRLRCQLRRLSRHQPLATRYPQRGGFPLLLRVEAQPGQPWGGMASHMLGIVSGLRANGLKPIVLSATLPEKLAALSDVNLLSPPNFGWNHPPTQVINAGLMAEKRILTLCRHKPVSFIYQRNSPFILGGLIAARRLGVPFLLEYNGSERWMAQHWGNGMKHEQLAESVELANLQQADLVITVSAVSASEVIGYGVDPARVICEPNGVDPEFFHPDKDDTPFRRDHDLGYKRYIGFSGSFGPWHGVEVLTAAFLCLMQRRPDLQADWGLLLIGDGDRRQAAQAMAAQAGFAALVVSTGVVQREAMPQALASCDILVSPQTNNPDGSDFFGSPIKLFEYMAMKKPVVASNLGQMAEVIEDEVCGLLTPPGNSIELATRLERLCDDAALRNRLGHAARQRVLQNFTWENHVASILRHLDKLTA